MAGWTLEPDYRHLAADFGSLDSVFALEGERLTRDPLSEVIRIERDGVRYYVKRYRSAGKGLRRYLARPRIKAEWQNLKRFEKWGIPTAEVVAWGLERKAGAFQRGAMITRELPGTEDLSVLACNRDPRLKDPRWVDGVSRQIAKATRLMHDQHFTHNDLKWRNLLVDDQPLVYFIDCPNGAFWWSFMLRYRITKDLACLDKVAKYHLSRTQRLRFYLQYRRRRHLNESDKKRIRQVVAFFEGANERFHRRAGPRPAPAQPSGQLRRPVGLAAGRRGRTEYRAGWLEQRLPPRPGRLRLLPEAPEQPPDPQPAPSAGRADLRPRVPQHRALPGAGHSRPAGGVLRPAGGRRRAPGDPPDPCPGRLAGPGHLAGVLARPGRRAAPGDSPGGWQAGAPAARRRTDAWLLLSQACIPPRGGRWCLRGLPDRPGEDPPDLVRPPRPGQGPGADAAPCPGLERSGRARIHLRLCRRTLDSAEVEQWYRLLDQRRRRKESRR